MLQAFVFNEVAVIARHWFEVGPEDNEHGARIELRRLVPQIRRGSESASQLIEIDEIVWRADLFDVIGAPPGNYERAHFHVNFEGIEPVDRSWDEALSLDPFGWTEAQLNDVEVLADRTGMQLCNPSEETADVRRALPEIMAALRRYAPTECATTAHCLAATRDTADTVLLMVSLFRDARAYGIDPRIAVA